MIDILIILLLILLNGFFAMSEIAVVSAKSTKLETERKKGNRGAEKALKLQSDPDNFLSSVQVGITLIGIINGAYGGATLAVHLVPFFKEFALTAPYAESISMIVVVAVITYLSIVVGELVPKTMALNNPEKVAAVVSRPMHIVSIIFYPFVHFLALSTSLFNKLIGLKPKDDVVSEMELRAMLKTASKEGVIEREENIIHEQVFYFSDKRARHLMTHRTDVEWVDVEKSRQEVIDALLLARHSKILACKNRIDDFVGTISVRDLLLRLNRNEDFSIEQLIVEPLIIPNTLKAQKVLQSLKSSFKFMAVVVDEYGSLDGIITLHDIFENLVGSIPEEAEEAQNPLIFVRDDGSALISGEAPIEILSQIDENFVVDFDEIDYSTVAGFVFACLNKIPGVGDKFDFENLSFEIMDIDGNRIDKVLVKRREDKIDEEKADKR